MFIYVCAYIHMCLCIYASIVHVYNMCVYIYHPPSVISYTHTTSIITSTYKIFICLVTIFLEVQIFIISVMENISMFIFYQYLPKSEFIILYSQGNSCRSFLS